MHIEDIRGDDDLSGEWEYRDGSCCTANDLQTSLELAERLYAEEAKKSENTKDTL